MLHCDRRPTYLDAKRSAKLVPCAFLSLYAILISVLGVGLTNYIAMLLIDDELRNVCHKSQSLRVPKANAANCKYCRSKP